MLVITCSQVIYYSYLCTSLEALESLEWPKASCLGSRSPGFSTRSSSTTSLSPFFCLPQNYTWDMLTSDLFMLGRNHLVFSSLVSKAFFSLCLPLGDLIYTDWKNSGLWVTSANASEQGNEKIQNILIE